MRFFHPSYICCPILRDEVDLLLCVGVYMCVSPDVIDIPDASQSWMTRGCGEGGEITSRMELNAKGGVVWLHYKCHLSYYIYKFIQSCNGVQNQMFIQYKVF